MIIPMYAFYIAFQVLLTCQRRHIRLVVFLVSDGGFLSFMNLGDVDSAMIDGDMESIIR